MKQEAKNAARREVARPGARAEMFGVELPVFVRHEHRARARDTSAAPPLPEGLGKLKRPAAVLIENVPPDCPLDILSTSLSGKGEGYRKAAAVVPSAAGIFEAGGSTAAAALDTADIERLFQPLG